MRFLNSGERSSIPTWLVTFKSIALDSRLSPPATAGFRMSCSKRNYGFGRTVDAPVWSRAAVTACQTIESPLKHSTHHG